MFLQFAPQPNCCFSNEELNLMATRTKKFVQLSFLLSDIGTLRLVMCFEIADSFYRNELSQRGGM
jgi:hypothetical protein